MSNFTFGHNVFKSRLLLLRRNASARGKGLNSAAADLLHEGKTQMIIITYVPVVLSVSPNMYPPYDRKPNGSSASVTWKFGNPAIVWLSTPISLSEVLSAAVTYVYYQNEYHTLVPI